jgi:hypothetical protein
MKPTLAAAALAAMLAAPAAQAQDAVAAETAAQLAALCTTTANDLRGHVAVAYCHGFFAGVGQYHAALYPPGRRSDPRFCVPSPAPTVGAAAASFATWVGANPQHAGERAVDAMLRWARATYPCPQARR